MKHIIFAAAAITLMALPADAQTISLHPGETVTVRVDNGNTTIEPGGQAGPMSDYEQYVLWRAQTQEAPVGVKIIPPTFLSQGEGPPNPPRPVPDRIQLTMRRVPALQPGLPDNTVLFLANGYGSMLSYRATMTANGRSRPTDVCQVPPALLGMEYWPYVIEELDLSDLQLQAPSDTMRCE